MKKNIRFVLSLKHEIHNTKETGPNAKKADSKLKGRKKEFLTINSDRNYFLVT